MKVCASGTIRGFALVGTMDGIALARTMDGILLCGNHEWFCAGGYHRWKLFCICDSGLNFATINGLGEPSC